MSRQRRRVLERRRRHAVVTRRVGVTGGLAVAATLLSGATTSASTPIPTRALLVAQRQAVTAAQAAPVVSSLSAYTGAAGSTVTITGSGFTGASSVKFGSVAATFSVVSDTEITATVPAGSGTVAVTVTGPGGTATNDPEFAYPGAVLTVTNTADSGSGSLRDVIGQVNAGGAHEITFASGVTGAINLASSLPDINNPVTIVGPGAGELSIDGGGKFDLFYLDSQAPSSISGLTITGSSTQGVYTDLGPLTLDADTVTENHGASGGGVYGETVTIENSTISGNSANYDGGGVQGGTLTVENSTISGNIAAYPGGGVSAGTNLTMTGSTVTDNSVTAPMTGGGGITVYGTGSTLEDSVVSGNTAASDPDIYGDYAGLSASFSLIGNSSGSDLTLDGTDIVGKAPMLGPLQNNGGPTLTMLPLPGSPLLDAGKAFGATTDQRGLGRTVDLGAVANASGGDGTDIGAVEVQMSSVPAVTGVSPPSGSAGVTVTVTGSGFTGASQVLFGSTPATSFSVASDGQIVATVPAGSGSVDVRVLGGYGESPVVAGDGFSYPAVTTTTPTSSTPTSTAPMSTTSTTSTTPTPISKPSSTALLRAVFDDQQLVLRTPAAGVCTRSPVSVSLASSLIKGSKAKRVSFLKAAFFIGKGVKHSRRVKVHGRVRTVVSYTPNVTVRKASSTARLSATKGSHVLKVVVSYRVRETVGHHIKTVTVTKTITARLRIC